MGIAKEAGIANGSLFTYFETKSELFNQLYLELKLEMASAATRNFPAEAELREQFFFHIWRNWGSWAVRFPEKRKALAQLSVSGEITPATQRNGTQNNGQVRWTDGADSDQWVHAQCLEKFCFGAHEFSCGGDHGSNDSGSRTQTREEYWRGSWAMTTAKLACTTTRRENLCWHRRRLRDSKFTANVVAETRAMLAETGFKS
jgi:hypothetical protein